MGPLDGREGEIGERVAVHHEEPIAQQRKSLAWPTRGAQNRWLPGVPHSKTDCSTVSDGPCHGVWSVMQIEDDRLYALSREPLEHTEDDGDSCDGYSRLCPDRGQRAQSGAESGGQNDCGREWCTH